MSIPEWPRELVKFERSGWQVQPQDARLRRHGDVGPPGYRRRFSAAGRIASMSLVVDRFQKAVFDHFFEVTCAKGSRLFRMPDPSTWGWDLRVDAQTAIFSADGQRILLAASWLCTFGDELPTETMVNDVEFRKTFSVNVMP